MRQVILAVILSSASGLAAAQQVQSCTKVERQAVNEALRSAKSLTLAAAAAVADTENYERWFGKYTPRHSDVVRANLKSVFTAIKSGRVTTTCAAIGFGACERSTYAFVYPDEPYNVYVCPPFFDLPTMASLRPEHPSGDNGTREGTFIHEISHFTRVARTVDRCYSRVDCSQMAQTDAFTAVRNADSYQYFTEDITLFRNPPAAAKPDQ
jgi:peptidyl-Lys metalloendopeptidase